MKIKMKILAVIFCAVALILGPGMAQAQAAQVNSNVATISLSYNVAEQITVSASVGSLTFTGATPTTPSFTVTTTWQLAAGHTRIDQNLYFSNPAQAMTDGIGDYITSTQVWANIGGAGYSACNKPPTADIVGETTGGVCNVGWGTNTPATTGTNTSTYSLQLQGLGTSLPAGAYTGTLNIAAGAN